MVELYGLSDRCYGYTIDATAISMPTAERSGYAVVCEPVRLLVYGTSTAQYGLYSIVHTGRAARTAGTAGPLACNNYKA